MVEQQACLILDGLTLFVHNLRMFAFLLSLCCYPQDASLILYNIMGFILIMVTL